MSFYHRSQSAYFGLNKCTSLFWVVASGGGGEEIFNVLYGNQFVFLIEVGLKVGDSLEFLNHVIIFYPK